LLLTASNVFMTYAWYGHLRALRDRPLWVAVVVSWGIAFFEYALQVPANRAGFGALALPQLKMLQEVITLLVFVPFSVLYMRQAPRLDFVLGRTLPARRGVLRVPRARGLTPRRGPARRGVWRRG
jgi:uncharacterized protein (DUF486 family)